MAESNRKGSFWLFEAGQRSLDATWELYQNNTQYGWYAGGGVPAATSLVDRIDFANDSPTSASPRGGLTTARFYLGAVGNADYGWFGGGQTPAPAAVSNVERIQYSNDSPSAASARGTFPAANSQIGAASNRYYGWFAGGLLPASVSTVLRIDFANDSPVSASIRGPLAVAGGLISGTGNQYYGYFSGGQAAAPAQVSYVQRTDYANDSPTSATQRGSLSQSRSGTAAVANTNYGWFGGGYIFPATYRSTVDRMDFANDSPTAAVPRGPLTAVKAGTGASGNQNYGWFTGALLPAVVSNVDRIDYSNDTVSASPRGFLTIAKGGHGAVAGIASYAGSTVSFLSTSTLLTPVANYGWWTGGYTVPPSPRSKSTVDRIDFSNDSPTTASARGSLTTTSNANAATSNTLYGWVNRSGGGSLDRIEISNDTTTALSRGTGFNSLPQDHAAAGNANYGWHGGGGLSTVQRLDYTNDVIAFSTRGSLASPSQALAAAGNANYGWFSGGNPGPLSQVSRIDYANDTTTAIARGSLPVGVANHAATSNQFYGWVLGGNVDVVVNRIDYANDTATASIRGPLSKSRDNFKGSGNSSFGWVGPSDMSDSSIDRINYSNDSPTAASARGNLSLARFSMASFANYVVAGYVSSTAGSGSPAFYVAPYAYGSSTVGTSGSQTYGWYGHGYSPGSVSSVDRVDFANDTTTASPRGALPTATFSSDTVGNQNYGWWAGGYSGTSATARVDFSNDGVAATVRGFLSAIRFRGGSVSSSNYGWIGFGQPSGSPAPTSIDRIDFSNESPTAASPRGTATVARTDEPGSVSNANYGWFGGGTIGSSAIERINFANDSPTIAASRGFMSRLKGGISSSGNANYGWFALGYDLSTNLYSSIDRLDFSNDTVTNQVRSNGSESRFWASGAGTSNYGWHGSGLPTPTTFTSRIERLDYANDTNGNAQTRSSFTVNRGANAAIANYVK
jgi:hypothetical protein